MCSYENIHVEIIKKKEEQERIRIKQKYLKDKQRLKTQWLFKQVDPNSRSQLTEYLNHITHLHIQWLKHQAPT